MTSSRRTSRAISRRLHRPCAMSMPPSASLRRPWRFSPRSSSLTCWAEPMTSPAPIARAGFSSMASTSIVMVGSSITRSSVISEIHSRFPNTAAMLINRVKFANQMHNRSGSQALTWSLTEFNISFANPSPNDISGLGTCSFLNGKYFSEYFKTGMADTFQDIDTWSIYQDGGSCDGGDLGYLGGGTMIPRSSYNHFQMISQFLLPGGAGYLSATSSNSLGSPLRTINRTEIAVMILNEATVHHI